MAALDKIRPSWDEYFLKLAHIVKERGNCLRGEVGAVIVRDRRIITTGYNGTPTGTDNCIDGGCERCFQREKDILKENERKDLCICIHAEQNAIIQAAYHGISVKGSTLYSTIAPCLQCAKAIINSGIAKVVYDERHQDDLGYDLLREAEIEVVEKAS